MPPTTLKLFTEIANMLKIKFPAKANKTKVIKAVKTALYATNFASLDDNPSVNEI